MSQSADAHFIEQFNSRAAHKYQSEGFLLRSCVSAAERIEGTKAYFPWFGKGTASKKIRGQRATPMNPPRGRTEATLQTWEVFDFLYYQDLNKTNVNERENIAMIGAKALGRGTDGEIVDVIHKKVSRTAATGKGVNPYLDANGQPGLVGGAGTKWDLAYAMKMCSALGQAEVPLDGEVYCPLPQLFWDIMMTYKQFNSSEWVGDENLSFVGKSGKGKKGKYWNGVNWFVAPGEYFRQSLDENHLELAMWHKGAAGWANNTTLQSWFDWENQLGAHSMRIESEGAAAAILEEGMVLGQFETSSELIVPQ
ncbi:phage capsid protein [Pseudovibrio sp. POLY-S9]|uniref:phage capsid protein n=1 Tax=Pseudovibrio sp. POLY-S9 TaxID=1576596 RepID=UPI00070B7965|nr:phage capsid protein [Pseudovibrio sp. POLY-S9]